VHHLNLDVNSKSNQSLAQLAGDVDGAPAVLVDGKKEILEYCRFVKDVYGVGDGGWVFSVGLNPAYCRVCVEGKNEMKR
jgi:hypothetical protein